MMHSHYRNSEEALLGSLSKIFEGGVPIMVRGEETLEIQAEVIRITHPLERIVAIRGRNNNIFAAIAESIWVLAGRDDVQFLSGYLKRAHQFSDDGVTWRGAYGPRLRNWHGVDQIRQAHDLLQRDPGTRRAVISIFDPILDTTDGLDIPCNNWLHFLRRDGRLHLHVAARSTDVWWGLSGINLFEWSMLLEAMAYWLDDEPGELTFFTSSLHLYQRHYGAANRLQESPSKLTYPISKLPTIQRFSTALEELDDTLSEWFTFEQRLRSGDDLHIGDVPFADPLLRQYLMMVDIYWAFRRRTASSELARRVQAIEHADLRAAAQEFLSRENRWLH